MIIHEISRIHVIVGGDNVQSIFRCPMELLFVLTCGKLHVRISNDVYFLCKKDNGVILKNVIIEKFHDSFKLILAPMIFDNQQLYITNTNSIR